MGTLRVPVLECAAGTLLGRTLCVPSGSPAPFYIAHRVSFEGAMAPSGSNYFQFFSVFLNFFGGVCSGVVVKGWK